MIAQVPGYVPQDGLVAWYPLDGNAQDGYGSNHATEVTCSWGQDRHGLPSSSALFLSEEDRIIGNSSQFPSNQRTISVWFKQDPAHFEEIISAFWSYGGGGPDEAVGSSSILFLGGGCGTLGLGHSAHYCNSLLGHDLSQETATTWNHIAFVVTADYRAFYLNGNLVAQEFDATNAVFVEDKIFTIGGGVSNDGEELLYSFLGQVDDVGVWSRALSQVEIAAISSEIEIINGCMDPTACNYDNSATVDDGTCVQCEILQMACGEGTFWDETTSTCIPVETCEEDLDGDGVIGVNDLMQLLSSFGTDCPLVEPAEWTCGDPISYHGYDYETVLIGEQCWFAENLRTELYQNGDTISGNLDANSWMDTDLGAQSIYGEGGSDCYDQSYEQNSCDENFTLDQYGRLYNWFAVDDSRGLCPSSWVVPSDDDFTQLEIEVAAEGYDGEIGSALKSQIGWYEPGNGVDAFGFSALAGGSRAHFSGYFVSVFTSGNFWSSTTNLEKSWARGLAYNSANFVRYEVDPNTGFSIRCIKD